MKSEAKVGIITIAALLILFAAIYRLGDYGLKDKGYAFSVDFSYGAGIQEGGSVRLAGVEVGKVTGVSVTPEQTARVDIWVRSGIELRRGYSYKISSGVLIADKYVDIFPTRDGGESVLPGMVVQGTSPVSMDQVVENVNEIMLRASMTLKSIDGLIGDPQVQRDFKSSVSNLRMASEKAALAADNLNFMIAGNQTGVASMVDNLSLMSANLKDTSKAVLEVASDREIIGDTKKAVKNIGTAGGKAAELMDNLNDITGDKTFRQDVKETVRSVRETADSLNATVGLVKKLSNTKVEPYFDLSYVAGDNRFRGDANLILRPPGDRFFLVGLSDLSNGSRINLQVGRQMNEKQAIRIGVIESSIGTALDIMPSSRLRLTSELYDISRLKMNLLGFYRMGGKWDVMMGMRDLFGDSRGVLGMRYTP